MNVARLLRTVRYLRWRQVVGFFRERLPVRVGAGEYTERAVTGEFIEGYLRPASLFPEGRVSLLNLEAVIGDWQEWHSPSRPRLWNYHLHYFEDPQASPEWLAKWMAENPVGDGTGWEPYPLSRRIVNWVRWKLRGGVAPAGFDASLAMQARVLFRKIEYRLLANHLFANAKALIYAGTYFCGAEAEGWLRTGLRILDEEIREQVGEDGGHFERSPMYHALILEDVLDLESLRRAYPGVFVARVAAVPGMLDWLAGMTHPDGGVAFFQDCCFGVAGSWLDLWAYGERLGLVEAGQGARPTKSVFFDGGSVGPDYQPGHAHAGTLSLEMSWGGERVVVNSGTSTYETGSVRDFERSTAAHATVRVDGRDSSEMWGSFRVARRARVKDAMEGAGGGVWWREAEHTGYGRVRHRRRVTVGVSTVTVRDEVTGGERVEWFFPLHPSVTVQGRELWRAGKRIGRMEPPPGVEFHVERAEWRPEFNRRVPAWRVRLESRGGGLFETRFQFEETTV